MGTIPMHGITHGFPPFPLLYACGHTQELYLKLEHESSHSYRVKRTYSYFFPEVPEQLIVGEATPSYGWFSRLIFHNFVRVTPPTTKMILLLRDPIDAVFSLHKHLHCNLCVHCHALLFKVL